ncbi:MAG: group II intron reverse transcriptase/maturase [Gemmatimonadota bacterium]
MTETKNLESISTKLERIAEIARKYRGKPLTPLSHFIDVEWLMEAHRRTRKDGAVGVDGGTAEQYAEHLEDNLRQLLDRAKAGYAYRAPPVRRVHIPKGDGRTRPIGIPTFEDKVLQRAVVMVLDAVYEQDFLDCSYGFRPGRSAHDALEAVWKHTMDLGGGWVLEADIASFFDSVDHGKLREILEKRIRDGVLLRLVGKWLNAGVMEEGQVRHPESGTPQGGVISPLLANVYLHEVLDVWFAEDVLPRLRGRAHLVRYADDFVIVFELEQDARRVLEVLPQRFAKYGLRLHPDKTRLVNFQRPPHDPNGKLGRSGSFNLLGFTLHWGLSRKGTAVVRRKTAKDRLARSFKAVSSWMRANRHRPVAEQHQQLMAKMRGHYSYYGVTGNMPALKAYMRRVIVLWHKWLSRRSQRAWIKWERMWALLRRYRLPRPRIVHSRLT